MKFTVNMKDPTVHEWLGVCPVLFLGTELGERGSTHTVFAVRVLTLHSGAEQPVLCVGMKTPTAVALTHLWHCPSEHGGRVVCSDCNTEVDCYSREQDFHPQPVSRDSVQPNGPEPGGSDEEHSPHQQCSGTAAGSCPECQGSLYPSNHDRMLTAVKKKPMASLDGKGNFLLSSEELLPGGLGAA